MEITAYHDSRQTACRFPFGAVPGGTAVTLHLVVQGRGTEAVFLRLWEDDREILLPMECTEKEQEAPERAEAREMEREPEVRSRRYGITFTVPERGCLVWYYFLIRQGEEICWYGSNEAQQGGMGQLWDREPPSFQITVYDRDSVTPAWLKQAVVYQIFPDRFCRGKVPADRFQGKPGALIHSAWEGDPCYVKDKEGQVAYYDFYGGTLEGILEKLPYLEELGVNCLYLNPIFQARSNHRYDTGDYKAIDPFLSSEETFRILCREARRHGMRILLDGVFSHTGADSRYFNRARTYKGLGAWQGPASPYYKWYHFRKYPEDYGCWWGDRSLPEVTETEPSYLDFIIRDKDSVLHHWLDAGISGWRLDVADELPDGFLTCFYQELKAKEPEAALIGEVWEDASNKESYGIQRQYLSGGKLDSVMNYVLRNLMLDFALGKTDAQGADRRYWQQVENYPRENLYAMLNLLGSHDVERLRTLLEARYEPEKARALNGLLRAWQMTLPGAPAVYYGDEAGLTGGRDPENRKPFPWGKEDKQLEGCCRSLIQLRRSHTALSTGRFQTFRAQGDGYVYGRFLEGGRDVFGQPGENGVFVIALNRGDQPLQAEVDTEGLAYGELEPVEPGGLDGSNADGKKAGAGYGRFLCTGSAASERCSVPVPGKSPGEGPWQAGGTGSRGAPPSHFPARGKRPGNPGFCSSVPGFPPGCRPEDLADPAPQSARAGGFSLFVPVRFRRSGSPVCRGLPAASERGPGICRILPEEPVLAGGLCPVPGSPEQVFRAALADLAGRTEKPGAGGPGESPPGAGKPDDQGRRRAVRVLESLAADSPGRPGPGHHPPGGYASLRGPGQC